MPFYFLLFLVGTETFLISPILPEIAQTFSISITKATHITTSYVLVYAFLSPFLGIISDKINRHAFFVIGSILFFSANLIASFAFNINVLICARAMTGLAAAMLGPSTWAWIGDTTSPKTLGKAMGYGMAAFSFGQIIGVPLGGIITSYWGWSFTFSSIAYATLPFFVSLSFLDKKYFYKRMNGEETKTLNYNIKEVFEVFGQKNIFIAVIITLFWAAANLGTYAYLGAFLKSKFYINTEKLSLIGFMVGGGSFIGSLMGGRLIDILHARKKQLKFSEALLLGFWSLFLGIFVLISTQLNSFAFTLVTISFWFIASGAFVTTQQTLLTSIAAKTRALVLAWNNSFMYAGTALGIWLIGFFLSDINLGFIAFLLSLPAFIFSILIFLKNKEKPLGKLY